MKKIAIHSVPRSGSTWLGQIFNSCLNVKYAYQPLFSYAFKSYLNENSSLDDINSFFEHLKNSNDSFINQKEEEEKGIIPTFKKNDFIDTVVYKEVRYHYIIENLLKKDKEIKIIGLIRNPFAVINSWLLAPKEFRAELGWNELEEWNFANKKNLKGREEYNGFQKWKEITILFDQLEKQYPNNFKVVLYDDLVSDVNTTVKELFRFCELELTEQTEAFLKPKIKRNDVDRYSVFKNISKDDKWKETLDKEIFNTILKELMSTNLEKIIKHEL